jgi:SRSO17 transposase
VLVIVETGFLKPGQASCGVGRQDTGSAGKITHCQIGVFAADVSRHGHALIDRALSLPKAWTNDPARRAAAHVPPGTAFATKPRLAQAMIKRAIAAGGPFAGVAGDPIYGVGEIERELRRAGKGYVLGVNATDLFNSWGDQPLVAGTAEAIAAALDEGAWQRLSAGRLSAGRLSAGRLSAGRLSAGRLSAGDGPKGERVYDWASCMTGLRV